MELIGILEESVKLGASDLHISPGAPPILRIDGELQEMPNQSVLSPETTRELIFSVMNQHQQEAFEHKHELDFNVILPSETANFRANAFYQTDGVAGAFRIIPAEIPTLEKLGTPEIVKKLLDLPNGLILITGPTGSGKSTTLAAMIEHINQSHAKHIITIEDPIEFKHKRIKSLISQRQVLSDTSNFATALRSALREDPDIILVGEMRDLETIRLALTAAETGHLVMATLHTSSAPRAISRIIDVFPAGEKNIIKNMLSQSLQAVICQILIKRIGGGRVGAYEIMLGSTAIRNLIREDKIAQMYSTIELSHQVGMITMEQSFRELVEKKIVSQEDARVGGFQREVFEKIMS